MGGAAAVNRDDQNFLEDRLQRELLLRAESEVRDSIEAVRKSPLERLTSTRSGPRHAALEERLRGIYASKVLLADSRALKAEGDRLESEGRITEALERDRRARALVEEARVLNPRDASLSR